tara:strand:- start:29483 stop:31870 length:2388 start_codon:yes stop_codon:yes gene_type:complete
MENQKSLQQVGSQQVKNNMQYLLAELQDKIQNQNIDVIQSVSDLVSEGNNPQEVAMALMEIGYDENVIKQIFQKLESNQQPEEEQEIKEVTTQHQPSSEHPESLQERVQQLQQEGMTAKMGKEKYNKGGHFKNWINKNYGYISDNDKYDVPSRFQSLPTEVNRTSGLDFVTDMFKVGNRAVGTVKDAIARKNDSSYNKYSVKFGKDANPNDFYITDQSFYEASKNKGDLMTKDQAARTMKDKSRFIYNPDNKAYSYALATNPFASESEIQNQINREMGKKYRDKYKEMSLPDYERTMNLFKSFIPGMQLGGGTHNTHYAQGGLKKYQIKGEKYDDDTLDRSNFYNDPFKPQQVFEGMTGPPEFDYGFLKKDDYIPTDLQQSPKLQDDDYDFRDNFEDEYSDLQKDTSAKVKIKNKGAFSKAFDTVTDVAGVAVDTGSSINKLLKDSENLRKKNNVDYSAADQKFGTDIGSKGYYTYQQEGILQPNMQTEYITQKGREMNSNRYRNLMMQYGGGNTPQMQQDNTRINQMSEADIQAYINMMNTARDEETFFKHFPYAKNMKEMQMGGMNPMSDFFMDNGLEMYQNGKEQSIEYFGRPGQIKRLNKLGSRNPLYQYLIDQQLPREVNEDNLIVSSTNPGYYRPRRMVGDDTIESFGGQDDYSVNVLGKNYNITDSDRLQFDIPNNLIRQIRKEGRRYLREDDPLQAYKDAMYAKENYEKPSPTSGPPLSPEMKKILENDNYRDNLYSKMYGGSTNPFSKKRQLRKKRGGQIANISTDVLKRLQEEANKNQKYKFNTL